MWQSRSCAQDPRCAGNVVCTDVLIHTCWGILQCATMLSLLKSSIASLITNAGDLFVILRWEALGGCHGCYLSYSGSFTPLFYCWSCVFHYKRHLNMNSATSISYFLHTGVQLGIISLMHRKWLQVLSIFLFLFPTYINTSLLNSMCLYPQCQHTSSVHVAIWKHPSLKSPNWLPGQYGINFKAL